MVRAFVTPGPKECGDSRMPTALLLCLWAHGDVDVCALCVVPHVCRVWPGWVCRIQTIRRLRTRIHSPCPFQCSAASSLRLLVQGSREGDQQACPSTVLPGLGTCSL